MLKGHTKIELTDVNTGKVKVVEDDNIVTNAMAKMLDSTAYASYNPNCNNPFNSTLPFIDRFCGGILLLKDPIEENPDNWMLPTGNRMIGNGRINYASPNDVPEFGAFNSEESSWNPETGERKYVYDFGTSKANGTISCVALTNFLNGYWGLGNSSGKRESMTVEQVDYSIPARMKYYFWDRSYNLPYRYSKSQGMTNPVSLKILFADHDENCIYAYSKYAFEYNSSNATHHVSYGKLVLSKIDTAFHSVNPMFPFGAERVNRIVKQIDITVPSEIASLSTSCTVYNAVCRADDAVYIVFVNNSSGYVNVNENFYVWKIGYDLKTSEVFTIKNTTDASLRINHHSYCHTVYIENGYLIISERNNSHRMFKIKMSDPTDITVFENITGCSTVPYLMKCGNTLVARYDFKNQGIVDQNDKIIRPINGTCEISGSSTDWLYYDFIPIRGKDNIYLMSKSCDFSDTLVVHHSFFMSTINNLPEPVVKTSDLSMKITYTLTPIGEEEGDS